MRLNQESTFVPGKIGHKLFILGKILIKQIVHIPISVFFFFFPYSGDHAAHLQLN